MVWSEWGRLTRFLESARIALARESDLWGSVEVTDSASVSIRSNQEGMTYQASLEQHRQAAADSWLLHASILLSYYALAEGAAAEKQGIDDAAAIGGIEVCGQRLLDAAGSSWQEVKGGKGGAVEVAVIRNTIAHGERHYTQRGVNRLKVAGVETPAAAGNPIELDYPSLHEYRARLRSLLRLGQVRGVGNSDVD